MGTLLKLVIFVAWVVAVFWVSFAIVSYLDRPGKG